MSTTPRAAYDDVSVTLDRAGAFLRAHTGAAAAETAGQQE